MVVRKDFRRNIPKNKVSLFSYWSVTSLLIFINVVLFFLFLILIKFNPSFFEFIAVKPSNVLSLNYIWTVITSMFMHGGFFHLFVNMFSLFFLGSLTERIIGRRRFFWFYLVAGIVGSLFFVFLAFAGSYFPRGDFLFGGLDDSAVGASGAIFGLLGLLAVLLPKKEIYLIVGPLIVLVVQLILNNVFPAASGIFDTLSTILIFIMIFSMFSMNLVIRRLALPLRLPFWIAPIIAIVPLFLIAAFVKLPIGNTAHLGGLVAGLIYGAYLRTKYRQKIKLLNRMIR
jgi:membrane associated rhomboid family serine protease